MHSNAAAARASAKRVLPLALGVLVALSSPGAHAVAQTGARPRQLSIRAGTLLDGRGGRSTNVVIRVADGRIVSVGPSADGVDYDLSALTVTPGWIDTHVHIHAHFNANGRFDNGDVASAETALAVAENARLTLYGGFTTIESVGAALALVGPGAAGSWSLANYGPRIIANNFDPGFAVEHFVKDMGIALDEAKRMGLVLPGLALAHQLYMSLRNTGHGRDGTQSLQWARSKRANIEWKNREEKK